MRVGIAGNGVSAVTLARRLRETDPSAVIDLFAGEPYHYYQRPKLIDFLAAECPEEDLYFYPPAWYEKNRITVRLSEPVLRLDAPLKKFVTAKREEGYDRIVVASGAASFMPPVAGADLKNVFCLRTLDDARAIRSAAGVSRAAVIVGGGVLGLETAAALRKLRPDLPVTVLEVIPRLLPRQLDVEGSELLAGLLAKRSIPVRTGVTIRSFTGGPAVTGVDLGGAAIPADLVVVSAGVRPDVGWLAGSGLRTNRGIVVDDRLETSAPGVFCLGDAAEHRETVYGIIKPAIEMAETVAANLLAPGSRAYEGSSSAKNTRILGSYLLSAGEFSPPDESDCRVIRAVRDSEYRKFVIRGDRLVGALSVGRRIPENKVVGLIASGSSVSSILDKLADPDYNFS